MSNSYCTFREKSKNSINKTAKCMSLNRATGAVYLNNGHSMELAPSGVDSLLYKRLLKYYNGDHSMATRAKASLLEQSSNNDSLSFASSVNFHKDSNGDLNYDPTIKNPNADLQVGELLKTINQIPGITITTRDFLNLGRQLKAGEVIYGYEFNGDIYINKNYLNLNTPIHEYTHVWAKAMMYHNPQGWNSIVELLQGSNVWNSVITDPSYADIQNDTNSVASEVLSRLTGKYGEELMQAEPTTVWGRLKQALQEFWKYVNTTLFNRKYFKDINDIQNQVLSDMINKVDLKLPMKSKAPTLDIIFDIDLSAVELNNGDLYSMEITPDSKIKLVLDPNITPQKVMNQIFSNPAVVQKISDMGYTPAFIEDLLNNDFSAKLFSIYLAQHRPLESAPTIDQEVIAIVQAVKTLQYYNYIAPIENRFGGFELLPATVVEMNEILRTAPRDIHGRLLVPNGEVSKLSEEQYALVRTKAFKEWFGDWERLAELEIIDTFNTKNIDTSKVDIEYHDKPWRNDSTHVNKTVRFYIKGDKSKGYFELVKDEEFGQFSIHFKTGDKTTGETYGSTAEERAILYEQMLNAVPDGAIISTWGEVSEGGINALNKIASRQGFSVVGQRQVTDNKGNNITIPLIQKENVNNSFDSNFETLQQEYDSLKSQVSKVIDPETHEPKIVYHGSTAKFNVFDKNKNRKGYWEHPDGKPPINIDSADTFFFSDNKAVAKSYALINKYTGATISNMGLPRMNTLLEAKKQAYKLSAREPIDEIYWEEVIDILGWNIIRYKLWPELKGEYLTLHNGKLAIDISSTTKKIYRELSESELLKAVQVYKDAIDKELELYKKPRKDWDDNDIPIVDLDEDVYSVFLNIREPFAYDYKGAMHKGLFKDKYPIEYINARQVAKAIKDGHDGVIYENIVDPYLANNYGIFDPNQIKSATTNHGSFSRSNNINWSKGDVQFYDGLITAEDDAVFVFGSNAASYNGNPAKGTGGAALAALQQGRIELNENMANTFSKSGKAYGIQTVTRPGARNSLTREQITDNIRKMYQEARKNPNKKFKVAYTNVGSKTSLNGYSGDQMIDMFIAAGPIPANVMFSREWGLTGKFNAQPQHINWSKGKPELFTHLEKILAPTGSKVFGRREMMDVYLDSDWNANLLEHFDLTPIKEEYKGKLIYALSGTGKSTIADNKTIYDSDYILGELLGVSTETAGFFFKTLSLKQKKAFGEQYREAIRQKIAEGKTVVTANISLLEEADVVVYNESAELTEQRVNAPNRAKTNKFSDKKYHLETLDKINKLRQNESTKDSKEYHSLSPGTYLSDIIYSYSGNIGENISLSERKTKTTSPRLTLDELISKFLEEFGISVNIIENYENDIPLFDALNRVINVKNPSEITDGVGYAIAFMMQSSPEMIKIFVNSLGLPDSHPLRRATLAMRGSGDTDIPIVKYIFKGVQNKGQKIIRQVGSQIAEELRNYFDNVINEDSTEYTPENKSIWTIIKDFFSKLFNKLNFYHVAKQKELFVSDIVEALGRADFSRIKGPLVKQGSTETAQIVNIEQALRENPFEDNIIRKLGEHGIALAGSASIALEGTLYRPKENPLHDIDFSAGNNSSKEQLDKLLPTIFEEGTIKYDHRIIKKRGEGCVTYIHLNVPFTTKPKKVEINGKKVKIVELYGLDGKYLGYKQHYDLYLEEGIQGKMLDFFVGKNKESEHGFYKKTINGHEYLLGSSKAALAAKILWARPKDMWDYKHFIPNSPSDASVDSSILEEFRTPDGELYGFVDEQGNIYLDETKVTEEHYIHEYTHLWDRAVAVKNPELWARGVELMKNLPLWKEIAESEVYGKKWEEKSEAEREFLIASEVHSRLVGEEGAKIIEKLEKSNKGLIKRLKAWLEDCWKALADTLRISKAKIQNLKLEDFNNMTMRDFVGGTDLLLTKLENSAFFSGLEQLLKNAGVYGENVAEVIERAKETTTEDDKGEVLEQQEEYKILWSYLLYLLDIGALTADERRGLLNGLASKYPDYAIDKIQGLVNRLYSFSADLLHRGYTLQTDIPKSKTGEYDFEKFLGGYNPLVKLNATNEELDKKFTKASFEVNAAEIISPNIFRKLFKAFSTDVTNLNHKTVERRIAGTYLFNELLPPPIKKDDKLTGEVPLNVPPIDLIFRTGSVAGNFAVAYLEMKGKTPDTITEFFGNKVEDPTAKGLIKDGYRVNNKGEKLFKWDENSMSLYAKQISKDANNPRYVYTVIVNKPEVVQDIYNDAVYNYGNQVISVLPFFSNFTPENIQIVKDIINDLQLNNSLIKAWKGEINDEFIETIFEKENYLQRLPFLFFSLIYYSPDYQNTYSSNYANVIMTSYYASRDLIEARIPTQAMQSFALLRVIGHTPFEDNIAYVSRWLLWLQGSDLDIDKAYLLGYSFDALGRFVFWSPIAQQNTVLELKASKTLPAPSHKVRFIGTVLGKSYSTDEEWNLLLSDYINITEDPAILRKYSQEFNLSEIEALKIALLGKMLKYLEENDITSITYNREEPQVLKIVKKLIQHQQFKPSAEGGKNLVATQLQETITDPANIIPMYSPIDEAMALFLTTINEKKKELEDSRKTMVLDLGTAVFEITHNNAVGKDDVSIMANALKVFFSTTLYLNRFYRKRWKELEKLAEILSKGNEKLKEQLLQKLLLNEPEWFLKRIRLGGYNKFVSTVSNVLLEKSLLHTLNQILINLATPVLLPKGAYDPITLLNYGKLQELYNNWMKAMEGAKIDVDIKDTAMPLSALVSLATDNAKTLALAVINAGVELASMHAYLTSMGVPPAQIVKFTTSPVFQYATSLLQSNIIAGKSAQIDSEFWKAMKALFGADNSDLLDFTLVYYSTQEMKKLAGLLGANQGFKADIDEMSKFISKFQSAYNGELIYDYLTADKKNVEEKKLKLISELINRTGFSDKLHSNLAGLYSEKLEKLYLDYHGGKYRNKNYPINSLNITDFFADPLYREFVIQISDISKLSINIFKLILDSPNFYAMLKSFSTYVDIISNLSAREQFVIKLAPILYNRDLLDSTVKSWQIKSLPKSYKESEAGYVRKIFDNYMWTRFMINRNPKPDINWEGWQGWSTDKGIKSFFGYTNLAIKQLMTETLKNNSPNKFLDNLTEHHTISNLISPQDNESEKIMVWNLKESLAVLNAGDSIQQTKYTKILLDFNKIKDLKIFDLLKDDNIKNNLIKYYNITENSTFGDMLYIYDMYTKQIGWSNGFELLFIDDIKNNASIINQYNSKLLSEDTKARNNEPVIKVMEGINKTQLYDEITRTDFMIALLKARRHEHAGLMRQNLRGSFFYIDTLLNKERNAAKIAKDQSSANISNQMNNLEVNLSEDC